MMYIMEDIESSDIDTKTDFILIEQLHKMFELNKNNTVLITGVHGDIGQAIACEFKKHNWFVIGLDIVCKTNIKYIDTFIQCDLSKSEKLKNIIETLPINKLDCIVNNAAIQICKPIWELNVEDWDNTMNCNLRPTFLLAKYGLNLLKKSENPNIINIGSVHSIASSNEISAYACSKTALTGLTKNMAIELSKFKIRVNSISPGAINTKMLRSGLMRGHVGKGNENDQLNKLSSKHLLGSVGTPENVSEFVYYLVSNNFITGANYIMDGGASIKLSTE